MKHKDIKVPVDDIDEKVKILSSPVEERARTFMKSGAIGPLNSLDYTFKIPTIIPRGTQRVSNVIKDVSKKLHELVMMGTHPTMNPFMDKLLEYESKDFLESIELMLKDDHEVIDIVEMDNRNDIMNLRISLRLLATNIFPFFEDDRIESEKITLIVPGCNLPL